MKHLILITFLTFLSFIIRGQYATVSTDKKNYKFEETIIATFEINAKYDSLNLPDLKGFKLLDGQSKSSYEKDNNEKKVSETIIYKLRPLESGLLMIPSPTYYINGKKIQGIHTFVKVDESKLTKEEAEKKDFQRFIEEGAKPKGTHRYIICKEKGYIERFGDLGWEFYRQLTKEEIELIDKIK